MVIFSMGDLHDPKMEVPTIYKAYFSGLCKGCLFLYLVAHQTNRKWVITPVIYMGFL